MRRSRTTLAVVAAALSLSLVATACGSSDDSSSDGGSAETTAAGSTETTAAGGSTETTAAGGSTETTAEQAELAEATLNASGATFPKAFYEEAIASFTEEQGAVTINYGGGGSGKGRQDLADQVVDWAGSDSPIKDEDKAGYKGGEVLLFPTVVAPITVSYNLDGVDGLQLSPATVAGIFMRKITSWDAAEIKADNPDLELPSTPITVARRSDSSGTTDNFTKFLNASAPEVWTLKSGSTVEWPADTQGGNGNAGVAQIVKDTAGAVGYVDLSDAEAAGLQTAAIGNKAGKFIEPTLEGASAAAEGATIKPDLTFSAVWADGETAYPITAQTWILVYAKQTDKAKGEAVKAFIRWILTDGQELAPEIGFGPLPKGLDEQALAQLDKIELPA